MNSELAQILDRVVTPEPWCVDNMSYNGEVIEMTGWALAPEGFHDLLTFTVNDREFQEIEFPLPRPHVAEVFWYKRGAENSGFRCRSSISRMELFKEGYAILKCVDRETGLPVREEFNIYYTESGGPELPDAERDSGVILWI